MKYDITEKLSFEENPVIVVKNEEIEVDASATTLLKIMQITTDPDLNEYEMTTALFDAIFPAKSKETIERLKLNGTDYMTVVKASIAVAQGDDPDAALVEDGTPTVL